MKVGLDADSETITERRVATLCKNGRIAGAKKQGNRWLIPSDTQKLADQRLKTGAFRKTLNMDMLRTYFEKSDKDTSVYFRDKKIWACGQKYRDIFAKETRRHKELLSSDSATSTTPLSSRAIRRTITTRSFGLCGICFPAGSRIMIIPQE